MSGLKKLKIQPGKYFYKDCGVWDVGKVTPMSSVSTWVSQGREHLSWVLKSE